jgi:hypothetical protein
MSVAGLSSRQHAVLDEVIAELHRVDESGVGQEREVTPEEYMAYVARRSMSILGWEE